MDSLLLEDPNGDLCPVPYPSLHMEGEIYLADFGQTKRPLLANIISHNPRYIFHLSLYLSSSFAAR